MHRGRIKNLSPTSEEMHTALKHVPRPTYSSNADEADLRIWLHCVHSTGNNILIFSPDTDVYHIGLTHIQLMPSKQIIIQLSKSLSVSPKLLHLNALVQALHDDPDLSPIPTSWIPQAIQSLYVCTGCDYISFFVGVGKCSFMSTLCQYSSFIASGT